MATAGGGRKSLWDRREVLIPTPKLQEQHQAREDPAQGRFNKHQENEIFLEAHPDLLTHPKNSPSRDGALWGQCLKGPDLPGVKTRPRGFPSSPPLYPFIDNFTQKHLLTKPFPFGRGVGSLLISRVWVKGLELGSVLQKCLQIGV